MLSLMLESSSLTSCMFVYRLELKSLRLFVLEDLSLSGAAKVDFLRRRAVVSWVRPALIPPNSELRFYLLKPSLAMECCLLKE